MTESEPTTPTQTPPAALPPGPPPHHAGWFNVYPLWAAGNFAGAQYASDRVRRLGQLSLWIAGGLLLLFVIFYAIFVMVLISQGGDWGHHRGYMD
jgi:hypothetical protein